MKHETFHYRTWDDVMETVRGENIFLPHSDDISVLFQTLPIGAYTCQNRLALQPMEGSDAHEDGSPSEYTRRRYIRYAEGGAGLIWLEAVASSPEIRASLHQLMLTPKTVDSFKRLVDETREAGMRKNGFAPIMVMQATNSGRYSKPRGIPEPLIAYRNPVLEEGIAMDDSRILSDDQLKKYEEHYYNLCLLCQQAGFDGMDVKCCHRYLSCELLSAYTRKGEYGGSFENRTRFLMNTFRYAQSAVRNPSFFLTCRLNAYDGFPYPWGFGVLPESGLEPVLDEAVRVVDMIKNEFHPPILNITAGNPYKNPHVNRPYDHGNYVPDEHPLEGESRMMKCVSAIQNAHPDLPIIGSAFTYMRALSPELAAGMIQGGHMQMAGFGRMGFAYPDFPNDLKETGKLDPHKLCVTCGQCARLLRAGKPAGCVVRDREMYKPAEN